MWCKTVISSSFKAVVSLILCTQSRTSSDWYGESIRLGLQTKELNRTSLTVCVLTNKLALKYYILLHMYVNNLAIYIALNTTLLGYRCTLSEWVVRVNRTKSCRDLCPRQPPWPNRGGRPQWDWDQASERLKSSWLLLTSTGKWRHQNSYIT